MSVVSDKNFVADFEYARSLTKKYSKSFYASASILPKETRLATYAVYAFCRYVDNIIDTPRIRSREELFMETSMVAKELQIAYRTGESQHPILRPFIAIALEYGIPIEYPLDLIRGVEMDVEQQRYTTFKELYVFCYRVAGVVGLMMTHVFGCREKEAFLYAEKMGIAMQLSNILRDIAEDASMNRIYLPLEDLQRFGVSEQDIMKQCCTGNIQQLVKYYTDKAEHFYHEATPGIGFLPRSAQYAVSSARRIYGGLLPLIRANNYNPFLGRVFVPSSLKARILMQEVVKTKMVGYPRVTGHTCPSASLYMPTFERV